MSAQHLRTLLAGTKKTAEQWVPAGARRMLGAARQRLRRADAVRPIDMGQLRRVTPVSRQWGSDRGLPIDRFYIESFLTEHAADNGFANWPEFNEKTNRLGAAARMGRVRRSRSRFAMAIIR